VANDTSINVTTATNMVGALEKAGNLGDMFNNNSNYGWGIAPNTATYYMAGIAYDAHTQDIRPDNVVGNEELKDKQTISTYWLDVVDTYVFEPKTNQFYLAAKYGGFDVPDKYLTYNSNNPAVMQSGLEKAFDDILRKLTKSSSALAVNNQNLTDGDLAYTSAYKVDGWSGEINAKKLPWTPPLASLPLDPLYGVLLIY
jgi:type IV pilus assembly protein PilY1